MFGHPERASSKRSSRLEGARPALPATRPTAPVAQPRIANGTRGRYGEYGKEVCGRWSGQRGIGYGEGESVAKGRLRVYAVASLWCVRPGLQPVCGRCSLMKGEWGGKPELKIEKAEALVV